MKKFLKYNKYNFKYKYPLKNITTIKNNGYAKYIVYVQNYLEFEKLIKFLKKKKIKYLIIGNGSKLIFIKNYKGVIISFKYLNKIEIKDYVEVEAGVYISSLIQTLKNNNLGGIEALIGIPSSIGGALINNASAHNISLYDYLDKILVYNDKLMFLDKKEIKYGYRFSSLKNKFIILKAYFKFDILDKKIIDENILKYLNYRNEKQEISYPNIGSIFKNYENIKAHKLIKECHLENYKYKNVSFSRKHLNFLSINGKTNGKNIYKFIKIIQKKVKKLTNIDLETEIIFIKS